MAQIDPSMWIKVEYAATKNGLKYFSEYKNDGLLINTGECNARHDWIFILGNEQSLVSAEPSISTNKI